MSWDLVIYLLAGFFIARMALGLYAKLFPPKNLTEEAPSGKVLASDRNTMVVDIRTAGEWQDTGVIKGAQLKTFVTARGFLNDIKPKMKDGQRLALICRSGNRSSKAAQKIARLVDFPVVNITGGMSRVVGEGYKPVKPDPRQGA